MPIEYLKLGQQDETIVINGYIVPHIVACHREDGSVTFRCESYALDIMFPDEAERIIDWVAHCMAVAAGYSTFGKGSVLLNQFARRIFRLDEVIDDSTNENG